MSSCDLPASPTSLFFLPRRFPFVIHSYSYPFYSNFRFTYNLLLEMATRPMPPSLASSYSSYQVRNLSNSYRSNPSCHDQSQQFRRHYQFHHACRYSHPALDDTCFNHDITTQATSGTGYDSILNDLEYEGGSRKTQNGYNGNDCGYRHNNANGGGSNIRKANRYTYPMTGMAIVLILGPV